MWWWRRMFKGLYGLKVVDSRYHIRVNKKYKRK
jgi:hypothetical protein